MLRRRPLRFVAGVLALATAAVPIAAATGAYGDPIGDKRAEAERVANKLDALENEAEILAEQYNDARLALSDVQQKVAAVKARVAATNAELAKRRDNVASYAVNAYMMGDQGGTATDVLASTDGNEVGRREGYTSAAIGDREDLLDRLHTAKAEAEVQTTALHEAEQSAEAAKAKVDAKRKAAQSAVDEQQQVVSKVKGELARLVAAEQRRQAAAAAARARAAARRTASHVSTSHPVVDEPAAPPVDSPSSPPSPPVANPPVGVGADAAIAAARSVLGVRYTWGGASPSTGFDCSGLVMWAWAHGGRSLPHSSAAQYSSTQHISMSDLQPGDLVFYGSPIHHVALYIGGGQIIHAPHTGSYVQVASVYYWSDVAGAGRV
ncbi:MAG: C40 family peptidase [Acidimicrobiia bacterium]|nr:C40 family peptidase [Acidimicrobiia bacterium]